MDHEKVREILGTIRSEIARYSQEHPEMPISYAVGYALAEDFEGCTMRELFRHADKNMYIEESGEDKRGSGPPGTSYSDPGWNQTAGISIFGLPVL